MSPSGMMFDGYLPDATMMRPKVCVTSRLEPPAIYLHTVTTIQRLQS